MTATQMPIEASHIRMFAKALGETDPVYFDDGAARRAGLDAIIAPPTFVEAAYHFDEDHLIPRFGQPWIGSGGEPTGVVPRPTGAGGLAAERSYEYHRPIYAGDVLDIAIVPGRRWSREGQRGGRLDFDETIAEYRNQHGQLVITAARVIVRPARAMSR